MGKGARGGLAAIGLGLLASGCALTRPPGPSCAAFADTAPPEGPADLILRPSTGAYVRPLQHLFGKPQALTAPSAAAADEAPVTVNLLLMSGGGQWGAYGSGFLNGLYGGPSGPPPVSPGSPPEIALGDYNDITTGVSTGAIMTLDVWSAVIHARRGEGEAARASLADLKSVYSYADPQLFRTENTLIYALFSNGLLDPRGRLEKLLTNKIAQETPLYETDPETQVEVGAVNLTNGNFYSFQLPEVVKAHASKSCFPEDPAGLRGDPAGLPARRFMDGEPLCRRRHPLSALRRPLRAQRDGGIPVQPAADHAQYPHDHQRQPVGQRPRPRTAAAAVACDASKPGPDPPRCPPIANSLLRLVFAGMGGGEGLVRARGPGRDAGSDQAGFGLPALHALARSSVCPARSSSPMCRTRNSPTRRRAPASPARARRRRGPRANTSITPFESVHLFAIGRYKGAAGQWDFSDAHAAGVANPPP